MVTTKKARKPTKKTTQKSLKKASKAKARVETGPVPPYGDPIRGAMARGDVQENA